MAVFALDDTISQLIIGAFAMLMFSDFLIGAKLLYIFFA